MHTEKQKFSSQADGTILNAIKEIAKEDGRQFQAVLEEAMLDYIEKKNSHTSRQHVIANLRTSIEKNRLLGELLAK